METVGGMVALVGMAIFLIGHFWLVFIIGRENLGAGLVSLVIFITSFYFIRNRWGEAKHPIYVLCLSVLIFVLGALIANDPVDA